MTTKSVQQGDAWGGLSAAALVLPQAMAFGIALWSPYTHDASSAALSGLVTALMLCLASGVSRGTVGLVSAPTGPTLVLLAGSMAALAQTGLEGPVLVVAVVLVIMAAGLMQILIGVFKLGHLIKFIPYPVVAGFMTGSAILMILSQTGAVSGSGLGQDVDVWRWIPAATAAVTFAAMVALPRFMPAIPGTVFGLLVGTLVFHVFMAMAPFGMPDDWVVGSLPSVMNLNIGLPSLPDSGLPWLLMLSSALALAVLASLDTLLTSVIADVATGSRHSSRRELIGQGAGHIISAFSGGMAGAGTTGATLVAIRSGGRIWVALATGLCFVGLLVFMGPVAAVLPISVFAGIILHVAIVGMLDKEMMLWLGSQRTRLDGGIALLVTGVTVFYDLMVAVGLGVVMAVIEFVRAQVQSPVVHRRWTLEERASLRRRPHKERELLAEHHERIVGFDLRGNLFFGTADHLFEQLSRELKRPVYLLLDMRRVTQIDLTALRMIEQMAVMARQSKGKMILSHVPKSMGLVKRKDAKNVSMMPFHARLKLNTFSYTDDALEYAENQLLGELGVEPKSRDAELDLREVDLLEGMDDDEIATAAGFLTRKEVNTGEFVFQAGEEGDSFFLILKGEVDVLLPYKKKRRMRLAKFGPGMSFGEIAFLQPGPRTAEAKVTEDAVLMMMKHEDIGRLQKKSPVIAIKLLTALGCGISRYLRGADEKLRRLAE